MLRFAPTELTEAELALQEEVRAFLAERLPRGSFRPGLGMAAPRDPGFSRELAARGWVGMALPRRYGGGDRSAVDRFVVVEELLRWGAPVGHHWVADRQTGPVIERFGSEAQKERFLPAICRGELSFSIGMSEREAGSDLAAVRTRATPADGGWLVSGAKLWTGGAGESDWFVVLCRTSDEAERHAGLTQLIVDLRSPGIDVRPIEYMDGTAFFNEVTLDEVFVPDELVLGEVGAGWAQNMSELAFERAGPERWLSTYLLVEQLLCERGDGLDGATTEAVGEAVAGWWGIRALSLSVARLLDAGEAPAAESALVKELGTRFEQEVLDSVWRLVGVEPDLRDGSPFERLLAASILGAPSFTIRGGTNEILRTVAARALRMNALATLRAGEPSRVAESEALGEWLLERDGIAAPDGGTVTVAPGTADDRLVLDGGRLTGTARRVPWARDAAVIVVLVDGRLVAVAREEAAIAEGANLAGEPRDTASFDSAPVEAVAAFDSAELRVRGALVRSLLMAGALERVSELTIRHATDRRQFGRPIGSFQAVQQHVVAAAQAAALVGVAADAAARRPAGFEVAAAKLLASRAAVTAGRAAHQVHGAIGTTREHPLSELTRRLWSWRSEHGDERYWSARLGAGMTRSGADDLYPAITGGSKVVEI